MKKEKILIILFSLILLGLMASSCETKYQETYEPEKRELETKLTATIVKIDNKIDILQAKLSDVNEVTKERINETVDQLKEKKEELEESLDDLKDLNNEEWLTYKSNVYKKYNDTETWLENTDFNLYEHAPIIKNDNQ